MAHDPLQQAWDAEQARRFDAYHTPKKVWECADCRRRSPADQRRTTDDPSVRCSLCRQPMKLLVPDGTGGHKKAC